MATGRGSVPITASGFTHAAAGGIIPVTRLWVDLAFARRGEKPLLRNCLLDTGAPLSVIPLATHDSRNFAWQPMPGPWPAGFTTWLGVACVIGQMDVWVPLPDPPFFRGPFAFIAKFAQATPPHISGDLPILLGLNFLIDHRAEATFQCHTIPHGGSIELR